FSGTLVPFSTARLTTTSFVVTAGPNAGAVGVLDVDPNNGLSAFRLDLTYLGTPVSLWIDEIRSIPAPGAAALTISGFVEDVPEPSAFAYLIGCVGTLLLVRRWRDAGV